LPRSERQHNLHASYRNGELVMPSQISRWFRRNRVALAPWIMGAVVVLIIYLVILRIAS